MDELLAGESSIDVQDWQAHTLYKNCTAADLQVHWFWQLLGSYSQSQLQALLSFVTCSPSPPAGELPCCCCCCSCWIPCSLSHSCACLLTNSLTVPPGCSLAVLTHSLTHTLARSPASLFVSHDQFQLDQMVSCDQHRQTCIGLFAHMTSVFCVLQAGLL